MHLVEIRGKRAYAIDPETGKEFRLSGEALNRWKALEYKVRELKEELSSTIMAQDMLILEEARRINGRS